MKAKKIKAKLLLNKKTVVNLNTNAMNGVIGGATFITDCRTACVTKCPLCPSRDCTIIC